MMMSLDSYCPECLNKTTFKCIGNSAGDIYCDICKAEFTSGMMVSGNPAKGEKCIEDIATIEKIDKMLERLREDHNNGIRHIQGMLLAYRNIQERNNKGMSFEKDIAED